MDTKEILQAAKMRIINKGWTQGKYGRDDGSCCALGAVNAAVTGDPFHYDNVKCRAAEDALHRHTGGEDIVDFNDAEDRTQEEVLAVFDKAIASLDEEGAR